MQIKLNTGRVRGKAKQGKARQGKAGQGRARQGKAGQSKARQGKAGQGKAGQGIYVLEGSEYKKGHDLNTSRPFQYRSS